MGRCDLAKVVTAVVIESRSLLREALVRLLESNSYEVIGSIASLLPAAFDPGSVAPTLVILGGLPADEAFHSADSIRSRWPEAKIAFLFEEVSSVDHSKMLASEFNACIPLFAASDTILDTFQQIVGMDFRVMILKRESALPVSAARLQRIQKPDPTRDDGLITLTALPIVSWCLSLRESEILRGVMQGQSNKVIARACGITDSTIKVHMKSIFRKLGVGNRTQAAILAVEQGC